MRNRTKVYERHEAAFAKVNLGLRVLGRRPDGFHEIRTVFQSIGFFDDVRVTLRMGGPRSVKLHCDRDDLNNKDNLAWRAADLLLRRLGVEALVCITLTKRIPVGSGLGGGSSDAAAVLRAVSSLLEDRPPRRLLRDVAGALGSDVPYFLVGGTALAAGRGTTVAAVPELPETWIVLALPDIEVSTAWAYGALAQSRRALTSPSPGASMKESDWTFPSLDLDTPESLSEWMLNDFEGVVFQQFPALRETKRQILACGARHALLSGSGSALFGLFASFRQTQRAAAALAAGGIRAEVVRFVRRADCGLALGRDEDPAEADLRK